MQLIRRFAAATTLTASLIGGTFAMAPSGWAAARTTAVTQTAGQYDTAVLADTPRFYWPLNETSGQVRDLTGHAAASTVTNAQLGVPGASGTAASFDGASQQIQVPYTSTMQLRGSFSAEVWAKLPASPQTSGWPTIFSRGNMTAGHFGTAMWVSTDSAHKVSFKRNGYDVGTARGLTTTAYRHLVFTWDSIPQRWTWYVDGTPDTSGVLPALSGVDTETAPLAIATMLVSAGGAPVNFGRLQLDGLALYGKALTASRVAAHYTAAGTQPPATYVGGVAVGGLQPWNSRRGADYQAMGAAHATWVRSDLAWAYLEQSPGSWQWGLYDAVVADTTAAGMRYLGILHTVPDWANGKAGDYAPPTDLSLETNYCYQTALHFLPRGVSDYEIGNEVNLPHPGWSAPTGAAYERQFLAPCVAGVRRAATELGKKVNLVFGSLAPTDWTGGAAPGTFLTDAYNAGAQGLFDAVGWHPYTGADMPYASTHMVGDPGMLHDIMAGRGDGAKQLWATEYGVPTGGPGSVTEQVQSDYVGSALDAWYGQPFAGPLFWYSARDTGTSATDREQHFGLLRYDGSAKPAYATLAARFTR